MRVESDDEYYRKQRRSIDVIIGLLCLLLALRVWLFCAAMGWVPA